MNIRSSIIILMFLLSSCATAPNQWDPKSLSTEVAIKVARPVLEKVFLAEAPVLPPSRSVFPKVPLPGKKRFEGNAKSKLHFDRNGNLLLSPGDYSIPVMTYCMKSNGSSPPGHIYSLASLQGKRAGLIRDINVKAVPRFNSPDVQILVWSLQAGLSYDELTDQSKKIVDFVFLEDGKELLKESFLRSFENNWNSLSEKSASLIPSFDHASDNFLESMGEVGTIVSNMRTFRSQLRISGNNYSVLSNLIDLKTEFSKGSPETGWSKVSDQVFARFVTEGSFQEVGLVQIRVMNQAQIRSPKSESKVTIDLSSWVAVPNDQSVQPLSFSLVVGSAGVLAVPALLESPYVAVAILSAVLASEVIDWSAFFRVYESLKYSTDPQVKGALKVGENALRKEHDELEKPLRDFGIIDRKTKDTSTSPKNSTREYEKLGGEEELRKDFDKFPIEVTKSEDGTESKILPDGKKIVYRPDAERGPTLELQTPKSESLDSLKIKVRYRTQ